MTELSRRRSIFVRTGDLPPLQLNERDKNIFKLILDLRAATAEQIHRSLFAPASMKPCVRRLQKLWLHGYIDRFFTPFVAMEGHFPHPTAHLYYRLTSKGAEQIADKKNSRLELAPLSPFYIAHQREINDFRTAMEAAMSRELGSGAKFTWTSESILRERVKLAKQKDLTLRRKPELVVADGLFSFILPSGNREFFFLEIDRGTESIWRLVQKAKAYVRLNRSDLKRTLHGLPSFRVLIVTSSYDRLMHLRARIAAIGDCLNMFWFVTSDEKQSDGSIISNLTPERILKPLWHKITDSGLHSLLGWSNQSGFGGNAEDEDMEQKE